MKSNFFTLLQPFILVLFLSVFVVGCDGKQELPGDGDSLYYESSLYGEWMFATTQEHILLTSTGVKYFQDLTSDRELLEISPITQNVIEAVTKEGDSVVLIRVYGKTKTVTGLLTSTSNCTVMLTHKYDENITYTTEVISGINSSFSFSDVRSGYYDVNITSNNGDVISDVVKITSDTFDLGHYRVVSSGESSLKLKYAIDKHPIYKDNLYAYPGIVYTGTIGISNLTKTAEVVSTIEPTYNHDEIYDFNISSGKFAIRFKTFSAVSKTIDVNLLINGSYTETLHFKVYRQGVKGGFNQQSDTTRAFLIQDGRTMNRLENNDLIPYAPNELIQVMVLDTQWVQAKYSFTFSDKNISLEQEGKIYTTNSEESNATVLLAQNSVTGVLTDRDVDVMTLSLSDLTAPTGFVDLSFAGVSAFYDTLNTDYNTSGNDDTLLDANETGAFSVAITNRGLFKAQDILIEMNTTDEYVTLLQRKAHLITVPKDTSVDTLEYNSSDSNYLHTVSGDYVAIANGLAPQNHPVLVTVKMTDLYGSVWYDSFTFYVGSATADIHLVDVSALTDDVNTTFGTLGNNDARLNKGEKARFSISMRNTSSNGAKGVVAELNTSDTFVHIEKMGSGSYDFGAFAVLDSTGRSQDDIAFMQRDYGLFQVTADAFTPDNHEANISVTLTDNKNNVWQDYFIFTVEKIAAYLKLSAISPLTDDVNSSKGTKGNNNSILNPGELARFNIAIENNGTSMAKEVSVDITSASPYVSISKLEPTASNFDYAASKTIDSQGYVLGDTHYLNRFYGAFGVVASDSTPDGHEANFTVTMEDTFGNRWEDGFSLTVKQILAHLSVVARSDFVDVTDSIKGTKGNNDSVLNPGETARFSLGILNDGSESARAVDIALSTDDAYVTVSNTYYTPLDYLKNSTMDTLGYKNSDSSNYVNRYYGGFSVAVDDKLPDDRNVTLHVTMTDITNKVWEDNITIPIKISQAILTYVDHSAFVDVNDSTKGVIGNGDFVVNPGETPRFNIAFKNENYRAANGVTVTLSSNDAYVHVVNLETNRSFGVNGYQTLDTFGYDSSDGNYTNAFYGNYKLVVEGNTPNEHNATIKIVFADNESHTWTDSFVVNVKALDAQVSVKEIPVAGDGFLTLLDDINASKETLGNLNAVLNPGETARFNLGVTNIGTKAVEELSFSFASSDARVAVSAVDYTPISLNKNETRNTRGYLESEAGYRYRNYGAFKVQAQGGSTQDYNSTITTTIYDKYGNRWVSSFVIEVKTLDIQLHLDGHSDFADIPEPTKGTKGNIDFNITRGEKARFNLGIQNTGQDHAYGVKFTMTSSNPDISVVAPSAQSLTIPAGKTYDTAGYSDANSSYLQLAYGNFYISAAPNTPEHSESNITVTMTDTFGNKQTDSFLVTTGYNATIAYVPPSGTIFFQDSNLSLGSNDGDNTLESNETATFNIAFSNDNKADVRKMSIKLDTNRTDVSFINSPYLVSIAKNETRDSKGVLDTNSSFYLQTTGAFTVDVGPTATGLVDVNVTFEDNTGTKWYDDFNFTIY